MIKTPRTQACPKLQALGSKPGGSKPAKRNHVAKILAHPQQNWHGNAVSYGNGSSP